MDGRMARISEAALCWPVAGATVKHDLVESPLARDPSRLTLLLQRRLALEKGLERVGGPRFTALLFAVSTSLVALAG